MFNFHKIDQNSENLQKSLPQKFLPLKVILLIKFDHFKQIQIRVSDMTSEQQTASNKENKLLKILKGKYQQAQLSVLTQSVLIYNISLLSN